MKKNRKKHETDELQEITQEQKKLPEQKRQPREKKRLHPVAQFILYLLLIISIGLTTIAAVATHYLLQEDAYLINAEELELCRVDEPVEEVGKKLLGIYRESGMPAVDKYCKGTNIRYAIYRRSSGRRLGSNMDYSMEENAAVLTYDKHSADDFYFQGIEDFKIKIHLDSTGKVTTPEIFFYILMNYMVEYRYEVLAALIAGVIVSGILFTILIRSACRPTNRKESFIYRIPLEILLGVYALFVFYFGRWLSLRIPAQLWNDWIPVVLYGAMGLLLLLHLIPRLRKEDWYRVTICYLVYRCISKLTALWKELFFSLPLIWRAVLIFAVLSAVEFAVVWMVLPAEKSTFLFMLLFWAEKIILIPFLLYFTLLFKRFHLAAKELASGNLRYQMNVTHMPGVFRKFGEDMNAVSESISLAVEEQMKSEHLKTELITNVSHDIKTPLTSIINFSDLIVKENSENPRIAEYAKHLYKQSARLKKLIEDLMEASKASTGNLDINMERCDVKVLLGQCMGEYEQRLAEQDIDLIVKDCPEPVWIMADTRMLWRIFDNLMNNIYKYAQSNTRVYLSTERNGDKVAISFKNISKYPLDVSAENLMERFVRGDLSRHTEGNGLGLSIVKSLMDLQGGKIELVVDGDLFKAILEFPVIEEG